ncbi:MAG TPA: hypothetical protein PLY91_07590 [Methanoregulaceae archaeon]|nr:hypothetical protein [Methanoregulaceae archaeon]
MDIIAFFDSHSGFFGFLASLIVALITLAYVVITWQLLDESKKMRMLQNQPRLSVAYQQRENRAYIIDLIIKNSGFGPAYNVNFVLEGDLEIRKGAVLSEIGAIKNGIPYLAPQQEIRIFLTYLLAKSEEEVGQPVNITVQYKDTFDQEYSYDFPLDLSLFIGMGGATKSPTEYLIDAIKDINRGLNSISTEISKKR